MRSLTGNHAGKIVHVNTIGEPDAGKLACPVRREATRKRTPSGAPRRVADPTSTLTRFLDAHAPKNLDQLATLLAKYRNHYNHRRRHQALKVGHPHLTPGQAWEAGDHRGSNGVAIDIATLQAKAMGYRDKALAKKAEHVPPQFVADLLEKEQIREKAALPATRSSAMT